MSSEPAPSPGDPLAPKLPHHPAGAADEVVEIDQYVVHYDKWVIVCDAEHVHARSEIVAIEPYTMLELLVTKGQERGIPCTGYKVITAHHPVPHSGVHCGGFEVHTLTDEDTANAMPATWVLTLPVEGRPAMVIVLSAPPTALYTALQQWLGVTEMTEVFIKTPRDGG